MATVQNADGTITQFVIGQDEAISVLNAAKPVKLNKDGTVAKKHGPVKKDHTPKKVFGAAIPVVDYDSLVAEHGTVTKAMNYLLSLHYKTKGQ
jgi:hypothetical protein